MLPRSADLHLLVVISVGEQHDDAVRMVRGLDLRSVEGHDLLACLDLVAFLDEIDEAVAVHGDRVDADVDQDLHIARAGDADGVPGVRD